MFDKRKCSCICLLMFVLFFVVTENVQANTLKEKSEKSYAFVSTDGELCSATVYCSVTQDYTEQGAIRTYTNRTGCTWMTYVATFTIPSLSATNPVYVDSSDTTIRTFSPWNNQQVILPGGSYCAYTKINTTNVGYSSNNKYYMKHGYLVGNNAYMGVPFYGGNVKMILGNGI